MAIRQLQKYTRQRTDLYDGEKYEQIVRVYVADYLDEIPEKAESEIDKGRIVHLPAILSPFLDDETGEIYQAYVFISHERKTAYDKPL